MMTFRCPKCQQPLEAPVSAVNEPVTCPSCQASLRVPPAGLPFAMHGTPPPSAPALTPIPLEPRYACS